MYQNCCKKCGSISLHTEVKGNNTGLYCDDCGAWVKWLGKDELRAFEHSKKNQSSIIEHTYENCHNFTCRRKCEKDGYNRAIDNFEDKAYDMLGSSDTDIYCKEIIREIVDQLRKCGKK